MLHFLCYPLFPLTSLSHCWSEITVGQSLVIIYIYEGEILKKMYRKDPSYSLLLHLSEYIYSTELLHHTGGWTPWKGVGSVK